MNETAARYAKAIQIVDFVWARAANYPELLNQVANYNAAEWREMAIQAGVSDGTYTPSAKTQSLVLGILVERVDNAEDPFRGLV